MLRKKKAENDAREKLKKEALQKLAMTQARKDCVRIIEKYWYKYLWKKEMKRMREHLKKLPIDCRSLWIELNCAKAQTSNLKQEIDDLIHHRKVNK